MLINLPKTGIVFDFNFFKWNAEIDKRASFSRLLFESRLNSATKIVITSLDNNKLPNQLDSCIDSDREGIIKEIGMFNVISHTGDERFERMVLEGSIFDCARFIWRMEERACMISSIGPQGTAKKLASIVDSLYESISKDTDSQSRHDFPLIKVYGTIMSDNSDHTSLIMDLLIGPVNFDWHLTDMIFSFKGNDGAAIINNFQGKQLRLFCRAIKKYNIVWNTCSIPKGWYALIQLPLIRVPININMEASIVTLSGWNESGNIIKSQNNLKEVMHAISLIAPVEGTWIILNTPELLSIHRLSVSIKNSTLYAPQRGAIDFVKNNTYGNNVEEHPAFGQIVKSPCSGKIIIVENSLPDNIIGDRDTNFPRGNQLVIKDQSGKFVILAHLRKGSVKVNVGDNVEAGKEIGQVGNSGNSSEPHLHMHVADNPDERFANGIPLVLLPFENR
ncbi:MAG: M23 family metallopeptidase [Saprospiraceae bacterium]